MTTTTLARTVKVFWNRHTKAWSVMERQRTSYHAARLVLTDALLVVRPKGRERVVRTGKRDIHAYVKGRMTDWTWNLPGGLVRAHYNPFRCGTFTLGDGSPVHQARAAFFLPNGELWLDI
jgi:hypothetical protein